MNAKKPLYSQIQDYIIQQIDNGHWLPDFRIPPEREIADQFQVSRITIKQAMVGLVNAGYLYRHRGKGTFVAARNATLPFSETKPDSPAAVSRKTIGFLMPWMESYYSSLLISGVEATLTRCSYHLLIKRVSSRADESRAIHDLMNMPVDGIIIVASQGEQHFNDDIVRLVLNKHPVVMVERTMRDIRTNGVYCNTKEIGELMVNYLSVRGVKHIGLVTYPAQYTIGVSDRISGFQSALIRRGLEPLSEQCIFSASPSILEESDRDEVPPNLLSFIESHPNFEAIATVDALLGKYVGMACAQLGRKHIQIICCDQPMLHPNCVHPVAYIDQSPYEMGVISAQMIIDAITNKSEPTKHMIVPRLIEFSPNQTAK